MAAAVELRVVARDHVPAPVHGGPRVVHFVAVHVVDTLGSFLIRGAVVDDYVAHADDASLVQCRVESHELGHGSVGARVEVPQVPGEVPLGRHRVGGRGQPEVGDARGGDVGNHVQEPAPPPPIFSLGGYPVEPLHQNHAAVPVVRLGAHQKELWWDDFIQRRVGFIVQRERFFGVVFDWGVVLTALQCEVGVVSVPADAALGVRGGWRVPARARGRHGTVGGLVPSLESLLVLFYRLVSSLRGGSVGGCALRTLVLGVVYRGVVLQLLDVTREAVPRRIGGGARSSEGALGGRVVVGALEGLVVGGALFADTTGALGEGLMFLGGFGNIDVADDGAPKEVGGIAAAALDILDHSLGSLG